MSELSPLRKQIKEYLHYCEYVRNFSGQTMHAKKWIYKQLIIFLEKQEVNNLSMMTNQHMNDFIAEQTSRGVSGRTINGRLAHIKAMIAYHRDMGISMKKLKLRMIVKVKEQPARRICYSRDQINQVLRYADQLAWLLIKLSFDCGFRISELRNLRLDQINGRMVKFVGKGNKSRESYMSTEARQRLDDWIWRHRVVDYLWVRPSSMVGAPYSVEEIRYAMRKPFHAAGLTNFYPHALRHSFGSDIQQKGASLMEIQQMMGHSNAETTQRYLHGLDGRLESLFEKYKDCDEKVAQPA